MLTWGERRARRRLRAELRRLHDLYAPDLKQKKGGEYESLLSEYLSERDIVATQLDSLESDELLRRAHRWSVELPNNAWDQGPAGDRYLTAPARTAIERAVRDERRKEIKFWADLLIPVLSLLVALVAVIANLCG